MSVGIGYLIPNFSKNLLSCQSVIFFLSGIGFSALHYIKTAVIYMIFRDLLNRKIIAMLVTVSIFLFLFFIYIDSLLGFIIPANYLPFLDLCIPYELYIGQASFLDAGFRGSSPDRGGSDRRFHMGKDLGEKGCARSFEK